MERSQNSETSNEEQEVTPFRRDVLILEVPDLDLENCHQEIAENLMDMQDSAEAAGSVDSCDVSEGMAIEEPPQAGSENTSDDESLQADERDDVLAGIEQISESAQRVTEICEGELVSEMIDAQSVECSDEAPNRELDSEGDPEEVGGEKELRIIIPELDSDEDAQAIVSSLLAALENDPAIMRCVLDLREIRLAPERVVERLPALFRQIRLQRDHEHPFTLELIVQ